MPIATDDRQYSRLDYGFADFFGERCKLQGEEKSRFTALLLELSAQQAAGNSCIPLSVENETLAASSGLASSNGFTPLIIDRHRLYLHRYWHYEQRLAEQLAALSGLHFPASAEHAIERYFPKETDGGDRQTQAARTAAVQGLTLITGGPGTGKTSTVVKILALLQEISEMPLDIALAAPTGKAAMRLQESIAANKTALPCPPQLKERIPENVTTLHRLLGAKPPTPDFIHCADNPLPNDVVVIDESSMVDLALMSKLVDALKPGARLILLGDKDQLASVESGAVLADLTRSLPQHTVELLKSYRFRGNIKALAGAVNRQDAEEAWRLLCASAEDTVRQETDPVAHIASRYREYLEMAAEGADFPVVFDAFNRFRVLCATRNGRNSVADTNARVEAALSNLGKISIDGPWYVGRPVMVTANDPGLHLFNGDIGLCLPDRESQSRLRVFFMRGDGNIKKLHPSHLPACETAYAMTIHKSQGSEFEEVLILLPDKISQVLCKELLYTAITRAKSRLRIAADAAVFMASVARRLQRHSGLGDKLTQLCRTHDI